MRYFATLAGQERTIDLEALGGPRFRLSIDGGPPHEVDAERLEGHVISLLIDGRSIEADLEEDGDALNVLVQDELVHLELVDERRRRLQVTRSGGAAAGPQLIKAPMPGKIVKLLVEVGALVLENQGLVVIEAMKMENELRATRAGRVTRIAVREGQTVEGRAELVVIE